MVYQFDTDVAAQYGVDEAILIQNLSFWIMKNEANGKHYHDGRYWTYNSIEAFTKLLPFWTARQIRRILQSLQDKGVIITGNYNTSAYDRTTWYAFSDSYLQNRPVHFTETSNGKTKSGKTNKDSIEEINTNTDDKPNDKPNNAAVGGLFPDEPEIIEAEQDFKPITHSHPRRTSENLCTFECSRYNDIELFQKEFTGLEFANVDVVYYYHAVADWSAGKGKKMRDWIATARNFIRSDMEKGKLHTLNNNGGLSADAIEYLKQMSE